MFKFSKSRHINFAKLYHEIDYLIGGIPIIKKRRKTRRIFKAVKVFSIFILAIFFIVLIVFFSQIGRISLIYNEAQKGKNNLLSGLVAVREENFIQAGIFADAGKNNFSLALNKNKEIKENFLIANFPLLRRQFENIEYLLNSGEILSRALNQGARLGQEVNSLLAKEKKVGYAELSIEEKRKVLQKIFESSPELTGIKAELDLALVNLVQIDYRGILFPLAGKIGEIEYALKEASFFLSRAIPFTQVLPIMAGYPEKSTYLVLLQNNDELRPTGGFLGTYGILEFKDSEITRLDTHDIYHMDMPVKDKINIQPPEPIKKYLVPKWYLRDANWSPDWPEAARQIEWFYKKEDALLAGKDQINNFNGEFNGVIGITPDFIVDLLAVIGPIKIEGVEYNKDNFTEILEYRVEKGYIQLGVPSWQRKEIIGDIAKEIKIRLFKLPTAELLSIFKIINKNILEKNIFIYLKDGGLQNIIEDQGLGGELKKAPSDYLMVVDANMGALKTDRVINRSIDYKINETEAGLIAKLRVNYSHNGKVDWKTSKYKTYARVYVPAGSRLISAQINKSDILDLGEVNIKNELGKTSFEAFFTLDPGEIGTLYFEYKLPDYILNDGLYQLYIQKQGGVFYKDLRVDINLAQNIESYSPVGFSAKKIDKKEIIWKGDLKTDRMFEINF
jgi:hypothetical protein